MDGAYRPQPRFLSDPAGETDLWTLPPVHSYRFRHRRNGSGVCGRRETARVTEVPVCCQERGLYTLPTVRLRQDEVQDRGLETHEDAETGKQAQAPRQR